MKLPPGLLLCTSDGAVLSGDDDSRRLLAGRDALLADSAASGAVFPPTETVHVEAEPVSWDRRHCLLVQAAGARGRARISRGAARAIVQRALLEGLVHDLRSPLNSIAMNAEMLRFSRESAAADANQAQRQERYVAAITSESARLGSAVSKLVDLIEETGVTPGDGALGRLLEAVGRFAVPALRTRQVDLCIERHAARALSVTDDLLLALLALLLSVAEQASHGDTVRLATRAGDGETTFELCLEGAGVADAATAARLSAEERATLLLVAVRIVNAVDGRIEMGPEEVVRVVLPRAA